MYFDKNLNLTFGMRGGWGLEARGWGLEAREGAGALKTKQYVRLSNEVK